MNEDNMCVNEKLVYSTQGEMLVIFLGINRLESEPWISYVKIDGGPVEQIPAYRCQIVFARNVKAS